MTQEERLTYCKLWITRLNGQWSSLDTDRTDALRFCNGDPTIVKLITGRSQVVTHDMQDAIDSAKPDILETLAGTDEPLKLDPTGAEDVEPVKKLQILANIQVKRKNPWFRRCADFLDDSMKLKFGCFKYQWIEKTKAIEKIYEDANDIEIKERVMSGATIIKDEMVDGKRRTTLSTETYDEYVEITTPPTERVKFPIDCRGFSTAPFVWEEVRLYEEEFRTLYGKDVLDKVKDIQENLSRPEVDSIQQERFKDVGGVKFIYDGDTGKYKAHECYFHEPDENRAWLFVFSGDEVILDEYNKYDRPPYEGGSPFLVAHRLLSLGYFDYLKEIQKERTFFKRQIFDNVTQANYRRYFGDPERLNMDDFLNNNATNALIRVDGDPSKVVMAEQKAPIPAEVLDFWELMNVEKDYHLPTPRSFTGVDPKKAQRTWRGQAQQTNLAQKKLLMMIRGYMEDVFSPLFNDVIDCILKFMKKKVSVRYLNEDYNINPDNIIGKFDLVVNVGLGSHDKNDMVMKLQQLIGLSAKLMETGVVTPQNLHYMTQELVKAMGFLNTTDFVTDPKLKEAIVKFIMMVSQMLHKMSMVPELQADVAQIAPQLYQEISEISMALGMPMGKQKGQGTLPGENVAPQAEVPGQALTEVMAIDGAGRGNGGGMGLHV